MGGASAIVSSENFVGLSVFICVHLWFRKGRAERQDVRSFQRSFWRSIEK